MTPRGGRLVALDWARGVAVLVNLVFIAVLPPYSAQFVHAPWIGLRAVDLVFPLFVTLAGAGMAFAYSRPVPVRVVLRRTLVLWACGLFYNAVLHDWPPVAQMRLMGPLQVYAVLVPLVAVVSTRLRRPGQWLAALVVLAGAMTAVDLMWAASCPDGLTRECNPSGTIDLALLGQGHMYRHGEAGHDPEGLVALAGAAMTALVGLVAGSVIREQRGRPGAGAAIVARVGALVIGCLVGAAVLQLVGVPVAKRIWTPSFALLAAVPGLLLLMAGCLLHDRVPRERRRPDARLLVPVGRNALLGYFGSHVVLHWLLLGNPSTARRLVTAVGGGDEASVMGRAVFAVLFMGGWWGLALLLDRRRVYITP